MLNLGSESSDVYDKFLPESAKTTHDDLHVTQIRESPAGDHGRHRPAIITIALSVSLVLNFVMTLLVVFYVISPMNHVVNRRNDSGFSVSEKGIAGKENSVKQLTICLPCQHLRGQKQNFEVCCQNSTESAVLLLKLFLNAREKKKAAVVFGQYHISAATGRERVSLKSSYVKAPSDSKLLPSTLNRIRVNKSGYYTVFGNLCFSEKDITGKSEPVIVTLEQVHSGFKSTIISKSEVVHWDPNSYVSVSFMENIWLNGATELLLFVNRPNVLYKFKDCNTIGIYKMH